MRSKPVPRIPTYLDFYLQPHGSTGGTSTEFEATLNAIDSHFEDLEWFFRAFQSLVTKMAQGSETIQRISTRHPLLGQLPILPVKRFITINPFELPLNVRNHLALMWRLYRLYDRRRLLSTLEHELSVLGVSVLSAKSFHMELRSHSTKEPDLAAHVDAVLEMLDQPVDFIEWLMEVRLGQFLLGRYHPSNEHDLAFRDWEQVVRSFKDTTDGPNNPIGDLGEMFRDSLTLNVAINDTADRCSALLGAVLAQPGIEHDEVVSFLVELPHAVLPAGTRQRIVLAFENILMLIDPIRREKVLKSIETRLYTRGKLGFFGKMRSGEMQGSHWQHLNIPVRFDMVQPDILCPWPWGANRTNDPSRDDGSSFFYEVTLPWSKCKEYCLRVLNSHLENKRQSLAYAWRDWDQMDALSKVIDKLESLPASDSVKMIVSQDELRAWVSAEGRSSDANGPYGYPRPENKYATLLVLEGMGVLLERRNTDLGVVRRIK